MQGKLFDAGSFAQYFHFQDEQLLQIVESAYNEAFDILYSEDGWKEEKKNDEGDVVVSRKSAKGKLTLRYPCIFPAHILMHRTTFSHTHTTNKHPIKRLEY